MNAEAREDIMDDTIIDEAHDCQDCSNARLIDRQMEEIRRLKAELAAINEALEVQNGKNVVLTYQIRTLREGK